VLRVASLGVDEAIASMYTRARENAFFCRR
jgi:hypothetical protein